jgi:hypothetical protein
MVCEKAFYGMAVSAQLLFPSFQIENKKGKASKSSGDMQREKKLGCQHINIVICWAHRQKVYFERGLVTKKAYR